MRYVDMFGLNRGWIAVSINCYCQHLCVQSLHSTVCGRVCVLCMCVYVGVLCACMCVCGGGAVCTQFPFLNALYNSYDFDVSLYFNPTVVHICLYHLPVLRTLNMQIK